MNACSQVLCVVHEVSVRPVMALDSQSTAATAEAAAAAAGAILPSARCYCHTQCQQVQECMEAESALSVRVKCACL